MMTAFQNQSARLKRGLGLLLVIFIFYGTTVEAAHRHGVVTPTSPNTVSVDQSGSKSTSQNTQPGCSDCLICQLHQNFSATLISVKPEAALLLQRTQARQLDPVSISSIATHPQSGRAPPQAN